MQRNLRRFGCVLPVLLDGSGSIVHGHALVAAARAIGLAEIPTVTVDGLSEPELRALRLSLHKVEELSCWDKKALQAELTDLASIDFGELLAFTAFSTEEIDVLLHAEPEEDETPELPKTAVSHRGDVWEVTPSLRLTCGDSHDPDAYRTLMRGAKAQLVLADPPYNVKIAGNVSKRKGAREFVAASGEMTPAEFTEFLSAAFALAVEHSADGALHLLFMDWRHVEEMMEAGRRSYSELKNLIVWAKSNAGMGSLWRSQHELLFAWKVGTAPHVNNVELGRHGRWRSNVWSYPGASSFGRNRDRELEGHVTPKCVGMLYDAILDVTKRGDVVLDNFCGSGSTLVAAHRAGRIGLGIEIDPRYVDVAVQRLERETGTPARHAGTGLTFAELTVQRGGSDALDT